MSPMAHLLNDIVSIEAMTGVNKWNVKTYAAAVMEKARIEWNQSETELGGKQSAPYAARLFLRPGVGIGLNYRVTISGVAYRVVKMMDAPRVTGAPDHVEAYLIEEE